MKDRRQKHKKLVFLKTKINKKEKPIMKRSLPFNIPFTCFSGTTFINCFTSVYMFLENIMGEDSLEGKTQDGQPCDNCSGHNKTSDYQQRLYFLFDTMCGHSSLRCRFNGELTEMQKMISDDSDSEIDIIKFLFDFTAYEYQKLTKPDEFKSAIIESINAGRPVIAKVNAEVNNFRVITGYDDDTMLSPDYAEAQNRPETTLQYDELTTLYVFGKKGKLVFSPLTSPLEKGLRRIEKVIDYNLHANLWDDYINKFRYWGELSEQPLEEIQLRFRRATETMWYTFNCHNFAETFRHCVYEEMRGAEFMDSWSRISIACDNLHTQAWSIIHLVGSINLNNRPEWGVCEIMPLIFEKMKQHDIEILDAVKHVLDILHQKRDMKSILIYN